MGGNANRWRGMRTTFRAAAILAATLLMIGCGSDPGATRQGEQIHGLYNVLFAVAAVVFVVVEGLIVWSVIGYRRRDDALPPQVHGNNRLELVWTAIPLVMVAVLFVLSWQVLAKVDAKAPSPRVTVVVQAFQWSWNFTYAGVRVPATDGEAPQDLTVKGRVGEPVELVLPVGEDIRVILESRDVIHAFYVPRFNFKRDAFPDHPNTVDLTITEPGVYRGQCAEYCGLYHSRMIFQVRAVPPDEFRAWLNQQVKRAASGCPGDASPDRITAKDITFDKACLAAKANTPFTMTFVNQDPVPHNVSIFRGSDASGPNVFLGEVFTGGQRVYRIPALAPGRYFYRCDVHPTAMTGTLLVR